MKQFVLSFNPDNESEIECSLTDRGFHYLIHVRRVSSGNIIPALSPDGRTFEMKILHIGKNFCTVILTRVVQKNSANDSRLPRITLIPAITKGKKIDLTIRQAVEAGTVAIWPVFTENCHGGKKKVLDNSGRNNRWNRIAVASLQQCGGIFPTVIETPCELPHILEKWNNKGPLFFLHEKKLGQMEPPSLHRCLSGPIEDLAIMTGPEGGLSPAEIKLLMEYGGKPVYFGHRVLRAETAAIYGLAAIRTIIRERAEWQMA